MAASGFTPIQLYHSTTNGALPLAGNLATGELAVNVYNGKLYYKNSNTGLVSILADGSLSSGNLPGGGVGTVVYQSATGVTAYLALGTAGFLLSAGATTPSYVNPNTLSVASATTATTSTNVAGGGANQIVYQSGAGATTFAIAPTGADIGKVLSWTGSVFSWVAAPASSTAVSLAGGAQYQIPFQSGVGVTTFNANLTFNSATNTFGTTNITTTGAITGPVVGSIIPFYYANQAAFPSAASYHGALAHSHADGAMYFAHSSAWVRLLDGDTDVTVPQGGTGLSTLTANNVILGNGTSSPLFVAPSTVGNVLTSTGSTWASAAAPVTGPSIAKTYYMAQF